MTLEQYVDEKLQPIIEQAIQRHERIRVRLNKLRKKHKLPALPYECSPEYRKWFTNKWYWNWQLLNKPKETPKVSVLTSFATIAAISSLGQ